MNKKFLATLLVGAVAATSIIGFTACNDNGGGSENGSNDGEDENIPDTIATGVQVDAEGWAKAFEATLASKNCTIKAHRETTFKAKGVHDELGEIDLSSTVTQEGTTYYDGSAYGKMKAKAVATGVPDDEYWQKEYKNQEYYTESYGVKDGETYYLATYSNEEEDAEWYVNETSTELDVIGELLHAEYAAAEDGESVELADLYESFTYEDGVYSATLWQYGVETAVSVSVKDGYVVSYSTECLYEFEYEGYTHSDGLKVVYNFSNYGKTTVNASDAAKKAVEDYKAANA